MSAVEMEDPTRRNASRTTKRKPRNVSSLTTQQIQHKRDLDRKAQRASRERVKSRLQDLEDDLARAKSASSDRERSMMEEIQALRAENRKLRSCLESIGQFALDGAAIAEPQDQPAHDTCSPDSVPVEEDEATAERIERSGSFDGDMIVDQDRTGCASEPVGTGGSSNLQLHHHGQGWGHEAPAGPDNNNIQDMARSSSGSYGRSTTSSSLTHPGSALVIPAPVLEPRSADTPYHHCAALSEQRDQYLDGAVEGYEGDIVTPPTMLTPTSSVVQHPIASGIAAVLPRHSSSVCPLDTILLDFMSSRRTMLTKGFTMDSILGPSQPSLQAIIHSERPAALHATSRVLTEVLSTFSHVALPEKAAFMLVMFRTMRWQLCPTPENYDAMPRWLRPTAIQITVPHSAWIDNIPWPQVRDMLIQTPEKYPHSVFSELYSRNVSINWPYEDMDTVFTQDDHVILNPIFEKHVRRLSNWTVSSSFKDYLPEMMSAIYGSD